MFVDDVDGWVKVGEDVVWLCFLVLVRFGSGFYEVLSSGLRSFFEVDNNGLEL